MGLFSNRSPITLKSGKNKTVAQEDQQSVSLMLLSHVYAPCGLLLYRSSQTWNLFMSNDKKANLWRHLCVCLPIDHKFEPIKIRIWSSYHVNYQLFVSSFQTSQVVDIQTIKCSDKQYCRDNQTCCLALGVPYGCCPLPKAVCCPNKRTCCPHGFVCVEYGKICLPRYQISKMETIRVAKRTRVALKKNTDITYDNSWLRGDKWYEVIWSLPFCKLPKW